MELKYRNVLVTGGAGFIGAHLALGVKRNFPLARVTALDNLKRRGSELNLARLSDGGVLFVHGDIRCEEDLVQGGKDVDLILECSAEPSVLLGRTSPGYMIGANLLGSLHCFQIAQETKADVIFFSTSRVYPVDALNNMTVEEGETRFRLCDQQTEAGASPHGVSTRFTLAGRRSLYGATKLASEIMLGELAHQHGFRCLVNRCGVVAGPWQMGKVDQGVFAWWMASAMAGRVLRYVGWGGAGKQVRDLLHVDDLVDLVLWEIEHMEKISGSTWNVGGGTFSNLSLCEATSLCSEILGRRVATESVLENRPDDIRVYVSDNREVADKTTWSPRRDARTILADIHHWLVQHPDYLSRLVS